MIFVYISRETPNKLLEIHYYWDDEVFNEIQEWVKPVLAGIRSGHDFKELFDAHECSNCIFYKYNSKLFNNQLGRII